MARSGSTATRNLSSMEELEKLEQSITLTLQEIDHNFSKAHRIVTTSIIPAVEKYGEQSEAVWEASKFWKQFFEASANVSLSGYEELANDDASTMLEESTVVQDETSADHTRGHEDQTITTTPGDGDATMDVDDSLLNDAELSGSTPRLPRTRTVKADKTGRGTPLDTTKREARRDEGGDETAALQDDEEDSTVLFAQRTAQLPDMLLTPRGQHEGGRSNKDPLLHRMLDKTYRIQATPHRPEARVSSPKRHASGKGKATWHEGEDTFMSSPEIAPPTLRSEVFMSPYKLMARQRAAAAARSPRTPGVSVQTPIAGGKSRNAFASEESGTRGGSRDRRGIDRRSRERDHEDDEEDDDDDLYAGMSPPKTIQFALPPSKLLQTPAREASRRIVDDILLNAGADPEDPDYSPTMVKVNDDILNDSF